MSTRILAPTPMGPNSPAVAPSQPKEGSVPPTPAKGPPLPQGARPWDRFGPLRPLEFAPIDVGGVTVQITRIPASADYGGQRVFPPFTLRDALEFAEQHHLALPTANTLDAAAKQGYYHAYQQGFYDVGKDTEPGGLNAPDRIVELGRRWGLALSKGDYDGKTPVANVTKAWILDVAGVKNPGMAVNRGFYDAKGSPIQKKGVAHNALYTDLAQGGVFVKRETSGGDYLDLAAKGAFGDPPVDWEEFTRAALGQKAFSGGGYEGEVSAYYRDKGYGIITESGGGRIQFFQPGDYAVGERVEYDIAYSPAGKVAVNVALAGIDFAGYWASVVTLAKRLFRVEPTIVVPAWPGNEHWSDGDIRRLVQISDAAGVNPADILLVHISETGGNPQAKNPGGAVGILQWIPSTAKALGTTAEEIGNMGVSEQLDILERHAQKYWKGRGIRNAADIYLLNATGGRVAHAGEAAYEGNKVWDVNKDGTLDKSDLATQLTKVWKRSFASDGPQRAVY